MVSFKKENLNNIKTIVQNKTGVRLNREESTSRASRTIVGRFAAATAGVLCFAVLSAFVYQRFNSLKGDELSLRSVYLGDGKFDIIVTNLSDKELILEDKVQLMQWSDSKPVEGNADLIKVEGSAIGAGETGIVSIDISNGYDVNDMIEKLDDGDWYYFVLTNNRFAFGQDWMCSINFEIGNTEHIIADKANEVNESQKPEPPGIEGLQGVSDEVSVIEGDGKLAFSDWAYPADELKISTYYGEYSSPQNPEQVFYSNHINIEGEYGDLIYAVSDGIVAKAEYDPKWGFQIILSVDENVYVMYGHLQEMKVAEGDTVSKGEVIGLMGATGLATGPNLAFAVSVNGEYVNPLAK